MTGKTITTDELSAAVAAYCKATGKHSSIGEAGKIRLFTGTPDPATDRVLWLDDGILRGDDLDFTLSFAEEYLRPSVMPVNGRSSVSKAIMPTGMKKAGNGALVKPGTIRDVQVADLSLDDIKEHICPAATDQEAFMFLKLCQARNLNPFTGEAYLVKYGGGKANMIVGKEAFTRKAELNPQFDGMEAGIIVTSSENGPEFTREAKTTPESAAKKPVIRKVNVIVRGTLMPDIFAASALLPTQ